MNDDTRKRGRTLIPVALATLAAAVALPVSGAFAGGDDSAGSSSSGTTVEQPGFAPAQDGQNDRDGQARPDGRDCPEGQDGDRGGDEGSSGSSSSTTEL